MKKKEINENEKKKTDKGGHWENVDALRLQLRFIPHQP